MERKKKEISVAGLFCPFYVLSLKYATITRKGYRTQWHICQVLCGDFYTQNWSMVAKSWIALVCTPETRGNERCCCCFCLDTVLFFACRKQDFLLTDIVLMFVWFSFQLLCFKKGNWETMCIAKLSFLEVDFHHIHFWPLTFCCFLAGNWLEPVWSQSRNWDLLFDGNM